jgi:hypothetical protein
MSGGAVCVVTPAAAVDLSEQVAPVQEQVAGPDALQRSVAGDWEWLWLLGAGARPRADALRLLLDAGPDAAIVAGTAVDSAGCIVTDQLPTVTARSLEDLVRCTARSLLPLRSTPFANALVRRACFARQGLPDTRRYGRWAAVQWSAAVLRERPGIFVPESVVELRHAAARGSRLADSAAFVRMLRSGAWTRGDAVSSFLTLRRSR